MNPFKKAEHKDTDVQAPPPSNCHIYCLQSDPIDLLKFIISKLQHIYNQPIIRRYSMATWSAVLSCLLI